MPKARGKFGLGIGSLRGNQKEVIFYEGSGRVQLDPGTNINDDVWIGTRTWTKKYSLRGKLFGNKFAQRVRVHTTLDEWGNRVVSGYEPIYGGMIDAKGRAVTTVELKRTAYHTNGGSRLDNGFDSLMTELRIGGIPQSYIDGLTTLWDGLSDKAKANVFNAYRTHGSIIMYGSSAIQDTNISSMGDILDSQAYYEIIRKLVEKEVLG